jgi:hypothetical protein
MSASRALAVTVTVGVAALALAAIHGCGPPCVDDRCSLSAPTQQTTKVDYTKPTSSTATVTTGSAAPATGSAAPATGSAAPVVAAGSGSAAPVAPVAAGSGSAAKPPDPTPTPTPPTPTSASWELWSSNQFKMYVISRAAVAANSKISFDIIKGPTKTPFVITLEVLPPGGLPASEGVWNDCPENKIRCDTPGTKTHVTRKAGQVLLQAGINWAVTGVTDESKGTLVTWTNNLSREVVQIRLIK